MDTEGKGVVVPAHSKNELEWTGLGLDLDLVVGGM